MTYQELYRIARESLPSAFEADELFRHACGHDARDLPNMGTQAVTEGLHDVLAALCSRRARGEPLQYLLGEWEFYSLPFKVGPGVLIPRQDSETLVDVALSLAKTRLPLAPDILDLCSGCGCIAIAIAHNLPEASVTAVESSSDAFEYLARNISLNRVSVVPVLSDLREYTHPACTDLIISNPPYIPRWDFPRLPPEVCHEPLAALDGGEDGLSFFRAIARRYRGQLKPGGLLVMEIGAGQQDKVTDILSEHGFKEITSHNDLTGTPRVVQATA